MTEYWSEKYLEAMAYIQDQRIIAALAVPGPAIAGSITGNMIADGSLSLFPPSTSKILAAISEPLGLPGASLPAYGVPGPGCCRDCLRPPVYSQGLCVYCGELARDAPCEQDLRDRNLGRTVVLMLLLTLGMLALLWAAGVIT